MPFLLPLLAGGGLGAWLGSQADDAIETVTGERGGIPWLQIALLLGIAYAAYNWFGKR
ncbi:hypothetical protein [Kordiimonas sp.]|uniref:hypothetical protein n=1 Tax=Kordiimonas sp. TaxID=1970157 RepID=UPI003A935DCB